MDEREWNKVLADLSPAAGEMVEGAEQTFTAPAVVAVEAREQFRIVVWTVYYEAFANGYEATDSRPLGLPEFTVLVGRAANELVTIRSEHSTANHKAIRAMAALDAYASIAADALKVCQTPHAFEMALRDGLDAYPKPAPHSGIERFETWRTRLAMRVLLRLRQQ